MSYHCPTRLVILALVLIVAACAPNLPRCNEDEVLIGRGEFEHGRWTRYVCGPAVDDGRESQ